MVDTPLILPGGKKEPNFEMHLRMLDPGGNTILVEGFGYVESQIALGDIAAKVDQLVVRTGDKMLNLRALFKGGVSTVEMKTLPPSSRLLQVEPSPEEPSPEDGAEKNGKALALAGKSLDLLCSELLEVSDGLKLPKVVQLVLAEIEKVLLREDQPSAGDM